MRRTLIFLLSLLLLAACTADLQPTAAPLPPTETTTPALAPSLTSTFTPTPTATITPTATPLTCWDDGGVLVSDVVPSELLEEDIPVSIYLPPCFFDRPEALYPTLYMIHGQSYNQDQWVRLGITEYADVLIASGEAAPFIIVMPYVADWRQPSDVPFGQAMAEEVLPYIEAYYQASPTREDRAVGGLSRGGSWSLHIGTRYWELFGAVGGHSAPVFLDDGSIILLWLNDIPVNQAPRIYLDIASSEMTDIRRSAAWFAGQLEAHGFAYEFHESYGAHNEDYWGAHVEEYLRFYTAEWKP